MVGHTVFLKITPGSRSGLEVGAIWKCEWFGSSIKFLEVGGHYMPPYSYVVFIYGVFSFCVTDRVGLG